MPALMGRVRYEAFSPVWPKLVESASCSNGIRKPVYHVVRAAWSPRARPAPATGAHVSAHRHGAADLTPGAR